MRIFTDVGKRQTYNQLGEFCCLLSPVDSDYLQLIGDHCDIAFVELCLAQRSPLSMPVIFPYTYILPKTAASFLVMAERWHEVMAKVFPGRDYRYNEQQQALLQKEFAAKTQLLREATEIFGDLAEQAPSLDPEHGVYGPTDFYRDRLEEQLYEQTLEEQVESLASADKDYTHPFLRYQTTPIIFHPMVYIDLKPLSWFIPKANWYKGVYVAYIDGRWRLRIKHTRKMHKHLNKVLYTPLKPSEQ